MSVANGAPSPPSTYEHLLSPILESFPRPSEMGLQWGRRREASDHMGPVNQDLIDTRASEVEDKTITQKTQDEPSDTEWFRFQRPNPSKQFTGNCRVYTRHEYLTAWEPA